MSKINEVLDCYNNSNKKADVRFDILPIIFRDDEYDKLKAVGGDSVNMNEYQFGRLGDTSLEMAMQMLENRNIKIVMGLWKGWFEQYGIERAFTYDFSKHPSIDEIYAYDEPTYEQIDRCKKIHDELEKRFPDFKVSTNLYPAYCPEHVLGSTYDEYILHFFDIVVKNQEKKIVSCDFYPFEIRNKLPAMSELWVYNHMLFAEQAKKYGAELEWCIQTSSYFMHRVVNKEDILMQMYMGLAFGVTTFCCFTYATPLVNPDFPAGCDAMIGSDYQPTSMYYATQDAIKELRKIEKVCTSFRYNGAKTFIGTNNYSGKRVDFEMLTENTPEMKEFKCLSDIVFSEDGVVTEAVDSNQNRYGYYFINYNDPIQKKYNKVKFTLKDADGCVVLVDGETKEFKGKEVELVLGVGGAAFVIPF